MLKTGQSQETLNWIAWAEDLFEASGVPNPRYDAECLLASVLDTERMRLYTHPEFLEERDVGLFKEQVRRRCRREPLQYILGHTSFYGRSFRVNRNVLIPRPETEQLVEECLKRKEPPRRILEIGTGSGCIAVTLALELPDAFITAVDAKVNALIVAQENARHHGVSDRIQFLCADLVSACNHHLQYDLLAANLPYIPEPDMRNLQAEVRDFEPMAALNGGEDGLALIRRLVTDTPAFLRPGGFLALEIGDGQEHMVLSEIERTCAFSGPHAVQDLAGRNRMVFAEKRG